MNLKTQLLVSVAAAFLCGCSTTITNITPSQLPRNPDHLYAFEVAFDTDQKTIREETIRPSVMVGTTLYPMEPVPMLKNRWETQVPIPAATNYLYYRYKFDYQYDRVSAPGASSRLSPTYQLEIVER